MSGIEEAKNGAQAGWEEAFRYFIIFKTAEGRSPRTVSDYGKHIRFFFKKYPDAFAQGPALRQSLLAYFSEPVKPATYNIRFTNLKAFFDWCRAEGYLPENPNPFRGLKKKKAEGRIVRIGPDVLTALLKLPNREYFSGTRDYALILLSLDTGIRPSEALALTTDDVNLKAYEVYIRAESAKTRVSRTLPFSNTTAAAIADLMRVRHPLWNSGTPVFCAATGNPFGLRDWEDRICMYSKILGTKIRPYDLRHTFALMYLKRGGNTFALQRTMGHTDLSMTRRYIALNDDDLREEHRKASPVEGIFKKRITVLKVAKIKKPE